MKNTHILRVLIGSRAHGIDTPKSDYDYKGVFFAPARLFFDPWGSPVRTIGHDDDVAYEFQHFIRLCCSGNPTALEVLFSAAEGNSVPLETGNWNPKLGKDLVDLRHNLLDSTRIYHAHRGFAQSQIKKLSAQDVTPFRYRKALATYIRVMGMGIDFFKDDVYKVRVPEKRRERLRQIRSLTDEQTLTHSSKQIITSMELRLDEAYECRTKTHVIDEKAREKIQLLAMEGYRE